MEQSIRLGRIAGIEIGLNWSLLLVFWLVAWSLAAARFPSQFTGYPTAVYWVAGVATAVVFFASLLAHELSHAVVARRAGVRVEGITLWLFGGVARFRGEAMTPREELRIAVVGPLMSLVLAGAFALVAFLLDAAGVPDLIVGTAAWLDSSMQSWQSSTLCPHSRLTAAGSLGRFSGGATKPGLLPPGPPPWPDASSAIC